MANLPANDYIGVVTRTQGEARTYFEQMRDFIAQLPGAQPSQELTIVSGAITPNREAHTVDTQGNASTDNLDRANLTNLPEGSQLTLKAASSTRTIVIRHQQGGQGQFMLLNGSSIRLTDTDQEVTFNRIGTNWVQKQVGNNLLPVSFQVVNQTRQIQLVPEQPYTLIISNDVHSITDTVLSLSVSYGNSSYTFRWQVRADSGVDGSRSLNATSEYIGSSTTGILNVTSSYSSSWVFDCLAIPVTRL